MTFDELEQVVGSDQLVEFYASEMWQKALVVKVDRLLPLVSLYCVDSATTFEITGDTDIHDRLRLSGSRLKEALVIFGNSDDLSSEQRRHILRVLLAEMELPLFHPIEAFYDEKECAEALRFSYEEASMDWVHTVLTYAQSLNLASVVTCDVKRTKNATQTRKGEKEA